MSEEENTATNLEEEETFDETQVGGEGEQQPQKEGEDAQSEKKEAKPQQSRERNHEEAQKRRERKAKAEAEKEANEAALRKARTEGQLELVKTNPYTNEPIEDEDDLEVYKLQLAIDKSGGDPVEDLPKWIAKQNRERRVKEATAEETRKKADEQARQEVEELRKAYPNLDTKKLSEDQDFQAYAEGKWGRWTMTELYEGYQLKLAGSKTAKETKEAQSEAEKVAKSISTPPDSTSAGVKKSRSFFEMSDEEFSAYVNKQTGRE